MVDVPQTATFGQGSAPSSPIHLKIEEQNPKELKRVTSQLNNYDLNSEKCLQLPLKPSSFSSKSTVSSSSTSAKGSSNQLATNYGELP